MAIAEHLVALEIPGVLLPPALTTRQYLGPGSAGGLNVVVVGFSRRASPGSAGDLGSVMGLARKPFLAHSTHPKIIILCSSRRMKS